MRWEKLFLTLLCNIILIIITIVVCNKRYKSILLFHSDNIKILESVQYVCLSLRRNRKFSANYQQNALQNSQFKGQFAEKY